MIGIYKIINQINGKVYIGQSINIVKRWNEHKTTAFNPKNKNYDIYLYRAIRKYGLENFIFEVIEECSPADLNAREIYWISYYDSCNRDKGYNMTLGGNATAINPKEICELWDQGYSIGEIAEKMKDKISYCTVKNYLHSYEKWNVTESRRRSALIAKKKKTKKYEIIKQYDLFGNFLKNWRSIGEAASSLNLNKNTIGIALKGAQYQAGGFQWKYGNEEDSSSIEDITNKVYLFYGIIQKDLNGNIINKYSNAQEAAKAMNTTSKNIIAACQHKNNRKTAKGFIWEYDYKVWNDPKMN